MSAPQTKQSRQAAPTPTVKGYRGGLTARGSITHAHTHMQTLCQHTTPACAYSRHGSRICASIDHSIHSQPSPGHRPSCHTHCMLLRSCRTCPQQGSIPSQVELAAQRSGPHHKTRPASHHPTRQFTPLPPEKHTCTHMHTRGLLVLQKPLSPL